MLCRDVTAFIREIVDFIESSNVRPEPQIARKTIDIHGWSHPRAGFAHDDIALFQIWLHKSRSKALAKVMGETCTRVWLARKVACGSVWHRSGVRECLAQEWLHRTEVT